MILALLAGLFIQTAPVTGNALTPTPTAAPKTEEEKKETETSTKYSVKRIKKPPFCIVVNANEFEDFSTSPWMAGSLSTINLLGSRNDASIEGEWEFHLSFNLDFSGDTEEFEGLVGGLAFGIGAKLDGQGTGKIVDLVKLKKKEEKEMKEKGISPTPTEKAVPIREKDPNMVKNSKEAPKELYKGEVELELKGTLMNTRGDNTVSGTISSPNGNQWVTANMNMIDEAQVNEKAKVRLLIDSDNNVVVYVDCAGKTFGPYVGVFTCEEELDIRRRDTTTYPIWGVWTDVNPYEPMPNLTKDLEKIREQLEKGESPKKINYPEGRWVQLKKGKKGEASTYKTLQVSPEDITYEEGEIWVYPGSAMFKPTAKTVYAKDLLSVLKEKPLLEYTQGIQYSTATDTIYYNGFGRLIRVRNANLLGVWSGIGEIDMPDPKNMINAPAGTWYEFVRATGEAAEQAHESFSAAYAFTRVIVGSDKSMEIDKGSAVIMPIAEDELVALYDIQSEKITADGVKTSKQKDGETLSVSDFNKAESTILFNKLKYTQIPGLSLKGSFTTVDPPVKGPDPEIGQFSILNAAGQYVDPPANAQWLSFSREKKTFTWTQVLKEDGGILIRTGDYRTIGKDLLLLTNILGSFYAYPGSGKESFQNKPYQYGEKLFVIKQETKDDKPVSLTISGEGKFLPLAD